MADDDDLDANTMNDWSLLSSTAITLPTNETEQAYKIQIEANVSNQVVLFRILLFSLKITCQLF